jgi:hypothetical protein
VEDLYNPQNQINYCLFTNLDAIIRVFYIPTIFFRPFFYIDKLIHCHNFKLKTEGMPSVFAFELLYLQKK